MKGMRKKALFFGMFAAICLAGCGSSTNSSAYDSKAEINNMSSGSLGDNAPEAIVGEESYYESTDSAMQTEDSVRDGRKLIRTANLEVETMDFDGLLSYVQEKTKELGGYVESMNAYNGSSYDNYTYSGSGYRNDRTASLTLRIPSENLDSFLTRVEENGNIISRSEREQDVTLSYVDLESHKKVLLTEQERLLVLLEQAATMEDIITLESRLSEIRYQIESMESQLRTFDNQIEYSTVYLNITEVVELTPVQTKEQTTWERIGEGFMHSLKSIGNGMKEFFIGFVIALPYLVLFAVIVLIIVAIILLSVKRGNIRRRKKMEELQKRQMEYMRQNGQYMQQGVFPAGGQAQGAVPQAGGQAQGAVPQAGGQATDRQQ